MDSKLDELVIENKKLENTIKSFQSELVKCKEIITLQQQCIFTGSSLQQFQKCLYCEKIFINESYLNSHLLRRHKKEKEKSEKASFVSQQNKATQTQTEELPIESCTTFKTPEKHLELSSADNSCFSNNSSNVSSESSHGKLSRRSHSLPSISSYSTLQDETMFDLEVTQEKYSSTLERDKVKRKSKNIKKKISAIGKKINSSFKSLSLQRK